MTLILGGMKSGKSSFAARLARDREELGPVVYLATAYAGDEEMTQRIRKHRADRPTHWETIEEELNPAGVISNLSGVKTLLMDCVTSWLSNLIAPLGEKPDHDEVIQFGRKEVNKLMVGIEDWEKGGGEAFLISNLVELGLVSLWPLGRVFQDLSGFTHQIIATAASRVYHVTAGLPLRLK